MSNDTLEKPPLDVLLDHQLHNLVQSTATHFYNVFGRRSHSVMISQEDLALEGYVGVTLAYESFDPNMGYTQNIPQSFRTHAFLYIKNAMLTYCRRFSHSLSISEKAARYDAKGLINIGVIHIDQLDDDEEFDIPVGSGVETSNDIDDYFLVGFTDFERGLVKDHIIHGYSLQEVSTRYGLSKSRAREVIRVLTERMRERAEKYDKSD